jgi:hypothetical protein
MANDSHGRNALTASGLLLAGAIVWSLVFGATLLAVLVAAAAAVPAGIAMWKGMQQESQKTSAYAILLLLASLAIAAVLLILRIIYWMR